MAPGIYKTFRKALKNNLYRYMDYDKSHLNYFWDHGYYSESHKEIIEKINGYIESDNSVLDELLGGVRLRSIFDDTDFDIIEDSVKDTERACYQAMEGLVHNLNTLHSRAGAQVPFSSINLGTDTSNAGRMVTKNLLLAMEAGLGNGETAIFPIVIFKVKDGVNYKLHDPNLDLLQLSYRVTAKRLFPNYVFEDATFNKQYYKPGHPETEVACMGCVQKDELVTYKFMDKLYVESIGRMYERLSLYYQIIHNGVSTYLDTYDGRLLIFDSYRGFVICKKVIVNPNMNNWVKVKLTNGRILTCTDDHPLPVLNGGIFVKRTFVKDINIGDKIPVSYHQYCEENELIDSDSAWLLGLILCDGCYNGSSVTISLGTDEIEAVEKVKCTLTKNFPNAIYKIIDRRLDRKQNYYDFIINFNDNGYTNSVILKLFEGQQKEYRHVPNNVFSWNKEAKLAFLAGMIDADGYTNSKANNKGARIQIGSTNKELAYGQLALAQALGLAGKIYENHYTSKNPDKVRYRVEFPVSEELYNHMVLSKKKVMYENSIVTYVVKKTFYSEVVSIEPVQANDSMTYSYDVETESDMFDVSGIISHNCRTRVMGNVYDPEREVAYGRGNLSFTTINLPMLALTADGNEDKFYELLDKYLELSKKQLLERFEIQAKRKVKNMSFLMGQGVWIDSDKLGPEDEIREVIKHGTMSIGFIGLAETLVALYGHHHGEGKEYWDKGYKIIKHIREYTDKISQEYKLNFSTFATPAEGYSGKSLKQCRNKFGIIKGVTDREYFTNSMHIPVYFDISAEEKIKLEAPFHELCNGGHICYIELDGDTTKNVGAIEAVVKCMHDNNIGYGAINHPVDRDPVCGYTGVINDECPCCHRKESEDGIKIERIRRITGYLVGSLDRWNDAKRAEEKDRVKHGI